MARGIERGVVVGLAVLFLAACARAGDGITGVPVEADVPTEVTLRVGQKAIIDGGAMQVTLEEVINDSRCPVDAPCVWAGNAIVALRLEGGAVSSAEARLNTHLQPNRVVHDGFALTLVDLLPERRAHRPQPDAAAYRVTLRIVRD